MSVPAVEVPVPVNVTVTSSLVAPESVAVSVISEPFSATELALVLKLQSVHSRYL